MSKHITSHPNLKSKIKTVIFDCDGVLWLLNDLIPGATDLVQYLHKNNIRTYFISNNSTKTTTEYLEKFKKLNFGVEISPDNVISAAKVTAKRCKDLKLEKVFVLGAKAIDYELSQYGIETVRHEDELEKGNVEFELDDGVQAVIAGMDREISYNKLAIASTYIVKKQLSFYGTNADAFLPNPYGTILPGGGLMMGALQGVSGKEPAEIFGKPNKAASEFIPGFEGSSTMMVGDRIDTDIHFGVNSGCGVCCLVMTGASGVDQIERLPEGSGWYAESVKDILKELRK